MLLITALCLQLDGKGIFLIWIVCSHPWSARAVRSFLCSMTFQLFVSKAKTVQDCMARLPVQPCLGAG